MQPVEKRYRQTDTQKDGDDGKRKMQIRGDERSDALTGLRRVSKHDMTHRWMAVDIRPDLITLHPVRSITSALILVI